MLSKIWYRWLRTSLKKCSKTLVEWVVGKRMLLQYIFSSVFVSIYWKNIASSDEKSLLAALLINYFHSEKLENFFVFSTNDSFKQSICYWLNSISTVKQGTFNMRINFNLPDQLNKTFLKCEILSNQVWFGRYGICLNLWFLYHQKLY